MTEKQQEILWAIITVASAYCLDRVMDFDGSRDRVWIYKHGDGKVITVTIDDNGSMSLEYSVFDERTCDWETVETKENTTFGDFREMISRLREGSDGQH